MNEEDRKLWTERIEDYRASGLTAVKWAEIVPEKKVENKNIFSPIKVTIGDATIEIVSGFDQNTFKDIVEILSKC